MLDDEEVDEEVPLLVELPVAAGIVLFPLLVNRPELEALFATATLDVDTTEDVVACVGIEMLRD